MQSWQVNVERVAARWLGNLAQATEWARRLHLEHWIVGLRLSIPPQIRHDAEDERAMARSRC